MLDKQNLRKHLQALRKNQFSHTIIAKSLRIAEHFFKLKAYAQCSTFGLYHAMPFEVQTELIFTRAMADRKICLFPKIRKKNLSFCKVDHISQLTKGAFGIAEPKFVNATNIMELLVIPCVGIDLWGNRIGQGGGFYDHFLENFKGVRIALAFDFQLYPTLPIQAHDKSVDWIVTEKKIYQCN